MMTTELTSSLDRIATELLGVDFSVEFEVDHDSPNTISLSCDDAGIFVNMDEGAWSAGKIEYSSPEFCSDGTVHCPAHFEYVETAVGMSTAVEALCAAIAHRHRAIADSVFDDLSELHDEIDKLRERLEVYEPSEKETNLPEIDGIPF